MDGPLFILAGIVIGLLLSAYHVPVQCFMMGDEGRSDLVRLKQTDVEGIINANN